MLLDWFTVGAQALNFLILMYLLKRFLYGPIIRTMEERKAKVQEHLASAEKARQEAAAYSQELKKQQKELELARESMLTEARNSVEAWRETALDTARKHVAEQRTSWLDSLEREHRLIAANIRQDVAAEVVALAKKVLTDLSDTELELRVVNHFIQRLGQEIAKDAIAGDLVVQLGFSVPEGSEEHIVKAIHATFPEVGKVDLTVQPSLTLGITLVAGDRKWDWNLESYLEGVEDSILASLAEER
ncbi:hypothetical protein [Halodesulfovibrio aestuarii]|uniref:F0F1 ATP synthase subunit B family protein n=1 Tax=Halodesulfovibrio aestuarii TaxID=126333 RepID=UPI003D3429BA